MTTTARPKSGDESPHSEGASLARRSESSDKPARGARREGIGLALSGGGFRATLFHGGALRRLNELGVLHRIRTISSVSGGSIAAAHIAERITWPLQAPLENWDARVAQPLRAFTSRNIRTKPVLKALLPFTTGAEELAAQYEKYLTRKRLSDLPLHPSFILCATDMAFGVNWTFERTAMGDYQAGYISPVPPQWPLARAVAASSCFPPVFNPLPVEFDPGDYRGGMVEPGPKRDACLRKLRLTDGGNYDNMGLEPIWKDHQVVIVSDGGALFDYEGDSNFFKRLLRYTAIADRQAHSLRKRWLISSFLSGVMEGVYWGIGSATSSYGVSGGYSRPLIDEVISQVRTDLDSFSDGEASVLENHGYLLADAAIRQHAPQLLPASVPEARVPNQAWMDESRVRASLSGSGSRRILGRGF